MQLCNQLKYQIHKVIIIKDDNELEYRKDLRGSGPVIRDRHEPFYPTTAAMSYHHNILHL